MRRKVDELGRITLPVGIRGRLQIREYDELEISTNGKTIILKKVIEKCIFCSCAVNLVKIGEICVCENCRNRLAKAKNGDILYPAEVD